MYVWHQTHGWHPVNFSYKMKLGLSGFLGCVSCFKFSGDYFHIPSLLFLPLPFPYNPPCGFSSVLLLWVICLKGDRRDFTLFWMGNTYTWQKSKKKSGKQSAFSSSFSLLTLPQSSHCTQFLGFCPVSLCFSKHMHIVLITPPPPAPKKKQSNVNTVPCF